MVMMPVFTVYQPTVYHPTTWPPFEGGQLRVRPIGARLRATMGRFVGPFGAVWGTLGVFGMLCFAIYRLTPKAIAAYEGGLTTVEWLIAGIVCVGMAYAEGYRGFQTRFSPRTAARIRYLCVKPDLTRSVLAPFFSMGFFHAQTRTRITAYALSSGIVVMVILVHRLDQPWRGIIDAGVVIGLVWGVLSLAWWLARALTRPSFDVSPEVPLTPRSSESAIEEG